MKTPWFDPLFKYWFLCWPLFIIIGPYALIAEFIKGGMQRVREL